MNRKDRVNSFAPNGETTGWAAVGLAFASFAFLAVVVLIGYYTDSAYAVTRLCETIGLVIFFLHISAWIFRKR
jgi:hypothetical protein